MSAEAAAQTKATKPAGKDLKDAIKRQVEFYFSRANLSNDAFLVSQMNSQMYVPVETIVSFGKIKQLTSSASLVVEAILDSTIVTLNETKDAIKPNLKSERNTIILREIPSATKPEDVQAIFAGCSGEVTSVRSDVGDTWFVTLASEEAAVNTLLELRSKTFNDAPIKARLKSENVLKSFYPAQQVEPVAMAAGGAYSRGYYATGYYDVANSYGPQYASSGGARGGQYSNGAPRQQGGRGGQQFRQNGGGRGGNANANAQAQQPKEARAKSGSFDQQQQRPASRKAKDKKTKADKQQTNSAAPASGAAPASSSSKKSSAAATAERQPVLNSLNFPPLPVPEKTNPYGEIKFSYAHEDILEIVKHMDETDCKLAEGKMDFEAHSVALTPVAHPDLLRNQRTYSIEQAREALRQGRPIRSDSIGSIDYESMMYGEDYTKEARELRKQKAEVATTTTVDDAKKTETPAKAAAAPKAAAAQPKVLGYAAAVIHGTPVPQPVVEAKKKTPAAAATASAPAAGAAAAAAAKGKPAKGGKDEKKAPAKKAGKTETAAPVVDETLPKSGAWGGRAFLEVVKSEPVSPPPAPAAAASNASASPSATAKKAVASKEPRRVVTDNQ